MDQPTETQALAKATPLEIVISTPGELRQYLSSQQAAQANVLSPIVDVGALPPQWSLVPAIVRINTMEVGGKFPGGDVYRDKLFCDEDEVALAKPALRKILRAMGVNIKTDRTDSNTVQNYWSFKATLTWRGLDGQMQEIEQSAEHDLRDGSPRVSKMIKAAERYKKSAANQIESARLHGYRICESRAVNAAARDLGLRQKYKIGELQRPFVVFNLVFQPDMTNPQQMAMVTQAALTGVSSLYPPGPALPAAPISHAEGHIVNDDTDETPQAKGEVPYESAKPATTSDEPTYTILGVWRTGEDLYCRTKETDDEPLFLASVALADAAKAAADGGRVVTLTIEERGDHRLITKLAEPL